MAGQVKVAVVSGPISSAPAGTADFIKAGFGAAKACIIFLSFDTADNAAVAAQGKASKGFSDFTNHRCISHQDEDGSAKVDCDARKSPTKAYVLLTVAGAVDIDGVASAIADGVRLTNTSNGSASAVFATVVLLGGADFQPSLNTVPVPSAVEGTQVVTTGIDQDLVLFIGTDIAAEDNSNTGIGSSFGVAHIDKSDHLTFINRCMGWASDHNNTLGSPASVLRADRCLKMLTENASDDWGIELVAATATSYTIRTKDVGAGAGMEVYALALDLNDRASKVGSVDSPIVGPTWTPAVALGFIPQYVGLGVTHAQVEGTIEADADAGGLGISSNTGPGEETFHGWYNQDGSANANTNNNFRSRVLDFRNHDVSVIVHDHSHLSFQLGDWTYTVNTENETVARKWFYWAIEEASVPPTRLPSQLQVEAEPFRGASVLTPEGVSLLPARVDILSRRRQPLLVEAEPFPDSTILTPEVFIHLPPRLLAIPPTRRPLQFAIEDQPFPVKSILTAETLTFLPLRQQQLQKLHIHSIDAEDNSLFSQLLIAETFTLLRARSVEVGGPPHFTWLGPPKPRFVGLP